jgi:molybdopterin converting factor small subunit
MVRLRFFGALRSFGDADGFFELPVEAGSVIPAGELKSLLTRELAKRGFGGEPVLITESVIADDENVIQDHEPVMIRDGLAVLPPVCGG